MYSVVLAVVLTSGSNAPDFFFKKHHAPAASTGCTGCSGGYGCGGCTGVVTRTYLGCTGCSGCYGCQGASCTGCTGCTGGFACTGCTGGFACSGCTGGFACSGGFACGGGTPLIGYHHGYGFGYYGTCDGGCYGVGHSWTNQVPLLPLLPPTQAEESKEKTPTDVEPKKNEPGDPKKPDMTNPERKEPERNENGGVQTPLNRARVVVELPADAKLYIDNHLTRSSESVRSFRTPALAPGQTYYYELRAELVVDGKVYEQKRRVEVRPGQEIVERFQDPRSVLKSDIQPATALKLPEK